MTQSMLRVVRRTTAFIALAFALTACGEDEAPAALPLAVEEQTDSVETTTSVAVELDETSTTLTSTTTSTTIATTTTSTTSTTSTTEAPPPAPQEPMLVVECATNPPHVSVTFAEPVGTTLDWTVTRVSHPGGTGMDPVNTEIASGTEVPDGPQIFDTTPNTLQFDVSVENESGDEYVAVGVTRYSGCPHAGSLGRRTVDSIDCISGIFAFIPDEDSGITVDSVLVDRWVGSDTELLVRTEGIYRVPNWNGPEEVKAVVTFSDASGTYEEHINHFCFGSPFINLGEYKICSDEAMRIAYPADWVSAIDLGTGEGMSCEFFRSGPDDGVVAHHVTIDVLSDTTIAEAEHTVLPPGPWTVVDSTTVSAGSFSEPLGPHTKNFARASYELAWTDSPDFVRRKVWLFELEVGSSTKVWRLEANLAGLDAIDGMASSVQFFVQ